MTADSTPSMADLMAAFPDASLAEILEAFPEFFLTFDEFLALVEA